MSKQERQVKAVLKKYNKIHLSKEELAQRKYNDRIGELRERYEELRWCKIRDSQMESYDRYMNVQGMLNKKPFKPEENPEQQKQSLK